ncbi:serine protease inhibitor Kazal-type 10-like [Fukomys damarensis]|uniref:serine protease inhibitor Kazal-type 10-like n=1 Tax=Fukomys damarensis TaxID=885580 RepID=UPI0008FECB90|nr:serine protease inhibitor Kazal-type 10-like [Fukomys damarensis]
MLFFKLWIKVISITALVFFLYPAADTGQKRVKSINCKKYAAVPYLCTREMDPVCGTDDITYSNRCVFCTKKLQSKGKLGFLHGGNC